jgi:hypothetical protein
MAAILLCSMHALGLRGGETMRATLLLAAFLLISLHAWASSRGQAEHGAVQATRIYVMRGLGDKAFSQGVDEIGALLKQRVPGAVVHVGNWHEWELFSAEAMQHPTDHVVFVGFSMGSAAAGLAAKQLAARRIPVKVIGLDPMCAAPAVDRDPHIEAVNFYATGCWGARDGRMINARNVRLPGFEGDLVGHIAFPSNPAIQALVLDEVLKANFRQMPSHVSTKSLQAR